MSCPDLAARLAACRAQLADLDLLMIAACEHAAGHGCRGHRPPPDTATWDRTTWRRYLAEVARQARILAARRRRLRAELRRLEPSRMVDADEAASVPRQH